MAWVVRLPAETQVHGRFLAVSPQMTSQRSHGMGGSASGGDAGPWEVLGGIAPDDFAALPWHGWFGFRRRRRSMGGSWRYRPRWLRSAPMAWVVWLPAETQVHGRFLAVSPQ